MDIQKMTEDVKREFLKVIIELLKSGKISVEESKKITGEFLALLSFETAQAMEQTLKEFTDKYPQFKDIYIYDLKVEDEVKVHELLDKMRNYMKNDNLDEALQVVK